MTQKFELRNRSAILFILLGICLILLTNQSTALDLNITTSNITQTTISEHGEKFDWTNYNRSQTKEKLLFMKLLKELCVLVKNPPNRESDPKAIPMSDAVFGLALKTYCNAPIRRFQSDLRIAREAEYIQREYHFNTMKDHLHHQCMNGVLRNLIQISSLPLKSLEQFFAADSTGFSTSKFQRWFDIRTQIDSRKRMWRKCHAICGVLTNVITSVEITSGEVNDTTQFIKLVKDTATNFSVEQVSADKAYLSRENAQLVADIGAEPFIPFKSNSTGKSRGSIAWNKMFVYFNEHQRKFMQNYHRRSNIESTFSMIKARFNNHLRSKKEEAQDNEILLKCLCHNICVVIQEMFLRGIEPNFLLYSEKCRERGGD